MITGELRNRVDRLWTTFWNNGMSNPLQIIEQLSYLIFMRRLEGLEVVEEKKERRGLPARRRFAGNDREKLRWSRLRNITDPAQQLTDAKAAFEHIKALPGLDDTPYARHMKDATFSVPEPVIGAAIRQVDEIFDHVARLEELEAEKGTTRKDLKGDLYEYMLSKLSQAGTNGQFRTPRHIIDMMVELRRPTLTDTICDPAAGTAGFLVSAARYIQDTFGPELVTDPAAFRHFQGPMFAVYDFDGTMLRIASMNLLLHGVEQPDVERADSLSDARKSVRERFTLIFANPPFKGSVDMDLVAEDLLKTLGQARKKKSKPRPRETEAVSSLAEEKKLPGAKTELLFLAQILGALKLGGRAAVIVPDGVLFGSSKAHIAIRKALVEEQLLEGIVSMPAGVFRPYAGVSTAVLLFVKTDAGGTENVWFYDMVADGYSLDDKRVEIPDDDIPDVIRKWRMREPATDLDRTAKAFFVPKAEIVGHDYDLSINRYKQVVHQEAIYETPGVILDRLLTVEREIQSGLEELRRLVG